MRNDQSSPRQPQPISAELMERFAEFAPVSLAMFDLQMRYLVVNGRWRTDFALGEQDLIGRSHYDVFPDIPERWKEVHSRCLAGATEKSDEDVFVRADGTVQWLRWEMFPWRDGAGDIGGLIVYGEDITARKNVELALKASEQQLRAHRNQLVEQVNLRTQDLTETVAKLNAEITERQRLEYALVEATSREQRRIGHDLHDGLGQELSGIALIASATASSLKKAGRPEAARVKHIADIANQAMTNCRAIAHGMSPLDFAGGSLVAALEEMAKLQRDSFGINVRCAVTDAAPIRLGQEAIENLYRISQEAVANARRHSQAKSITVTLNIQPTTLRLDVVDDGIGLSQAPATPTGVGLKIMEFRAKLIGARLTIRTIVEYKGASLCVLPDFRFGALAPLFLASLTRSCFSW